MNKIILSLIFGIIINSTVYGQVIANTEEHKKEIISLIDKYLKARENKNKDVLWSILDPDIDQLVSSGVWRIGIEECVEGMMQSSTSNPGKRSIVVDKIKLLNPEAGIADAKYEIVNADGSVRRMWSTFIVVNDGRGWKIVAIRNMRYSGS